MSTCYNCFKEKPANEETCPHCGYTNPSEIDEHYYLPQGTILHDRYTIGRVLGHGGFGITYVGHDNKLDILVAVKEYLPTDVASRAIGETTVTTFSGDKKDQYEYGLVRFLDEAKTLARYNQHPCIVSTTDFFETNNTAYLVMEFLDGIPLNEYLKRKGGSIPWDSTLEIMMPVMDALREVHQSGMIHRDISPDNIYITKTGQVKLLDFGAARFALGEKSKSLSVVLKPGYAPPEQYSTRGKQGPWTDVYAVAATMYKMLTGQPMVEAMDRSMDDHYHKPSELGVAISQEKESGLVKALEFRPENRWQSIEDLQRALTESKPAEIVKVQDKTEAISESLKEPVNEPVKEHQYIPKPKVTDEVPVDVAKIMEKEEKKRQRKKWLMGLSGVAVIAIIVILAVTGGSRDDEATTIGDSDTQTMTENNVLSDNEEEENHATIDMTISTNEINRFTVNTVDDEHFYFGYGGINSMGQHVFMNTVDNDYIALMIYDNDGVLQSELTLDLGFDGKRGYVMNIHLDEHDNIYVVYHEIYKGSFIIKYNQRGNKMWEYQFKARVNSLAILDDESILILGEADEDLEWGDYYATDNQQAYLIKLSSDGEIMWDNMYGGNDQEYPSAMLVKDNGNIIIGVGSYSSDINQGDVYGSSDQWIIELDKDGTIIRESVIGTYGWDRPSSIIEGHNGELIVCGTSDGFGAMRTESFGMKDVWIYALDNEFNMLWEISLGSDWHDYGQIHYAKDGYVVFYSTNEEVELDSGGITWEYRRFHQVLLSKAGEVIEETLLDDVDNGFNYDSIVEFSENQYLLRTSFERSDLSRDDENYYQEIYNSEVVLFEIEVK